MCGRVAELSHATSVGTVRDLLGRVGDGDGSGGMADGDMQQRGHDRDLDGEGEDAMRMDLIMLHVISSWSMRDLWLETLANQTPCPCIRNATISDPQNQSSF
jgi:hypothetical protein